MKRIATALVILGLVLLPNAARADTVALFTATTTSGTYGCVNNQGSFMPCDLAGYTQVSVQVVSSAGCSSGTTAAIQVRNDPSQAFSTVATISNPSTTEQGYVGPGVGQLQVVLTYGTCTSVTGTLVRNK